MINRKPIRTIPRICAVVLIVAGITAFYFFLFHEANHTTIALTFLLATLGIATAWGLAEAVVASVAGVLCFNFFFLPPLFTLYLSDTQNWVALFAFLVTAVVASHLSTSTKQRALEATRQREEVERLYQLSRALMLLDAQSSTALQISQSVARVFEVEGVAVFDRETDQIYTTGIINPSTSDIRLREATLKGTAFQDTGARLSILPLTLGKETVGSLAMCGGSVSHTATQAIANLAAIVVERTRIEAVASRMEAVRQNEAMKSMLLDALAHEFKTPLTSIKAAASSILDEEGAAQTELRTVIEEETDRLDYLVTETLRMAQIEAGDLELQIRPQPVRHLVDFALEKLKILLEDRQVRIEIPTSLPSVLADEELAGLAIRQLVTNALKYSSPDSPIEVRGCVDHGMVKLSVKDRGAGIPPREKTRIFDRYYRMPRNAAGVPGTGLGLHIARNIVEAHGGRIWVESDPEKGSEFFFTLRIVEQQLRERTEPTS